ncbi:MAG: hypothetical protein PVH80_08695 [Anaerolineae bacterium]
METKRLTHRPHHKAFMQSRIEYQRALSPSSFYNNEFEGIIVLRLAI